MKRNKGNIRNKKNKKFIILIVFCIAIISVVAIYIAGPLADAGIHRGVYVVNSEHDDARTFTTNSDTGYGNEDGKWAILQLSPSYSFGVRFTNVTIPRYALIKTAYIELYSIGTPNHRHPVCRIYCDDVDNASNFTSTIGVLNISGRVYTSRYSDWNTTVPFAKWVSTPSLVDPMQEVIDRQNWNPGNAIAFLFVSKGTLDCAAAFQNYENGQPAKLYVEWEVVIPE